ncbi:MAG: trigger factor [Rickettsiales bacterium]|jgi:trigger factor|nr:trigger factor [Rickettsiales bacterium]
MKVKEKVKGLNYKFNFVVEKGDFDKKYEEQLQKIMPSVKIKGFREGKVPSDVVRQKYDSEITSEALESLISSTITEYLKEKKLSPALRPNVKIEKFEKGKDVEFEVDFDVLPEIPDVDFSKIEVKKEVAPVTAKEIDASLLQIAESRSFLKPVEEDRAVKKGDVAVIDFEGFVDGVAFEGGKGANHPLEIGSGQFIPGFEDGLIGKKKGDEVDVKVTFPKEYHAAQLAGKKSVFKVKVNELKERIIPIINDEFAVELGRKDLADLKGYIEELLKGKNESEAGIKMQDQILEILDKKVKFDLPETLVNQELAYMKQQDKEKSEKELLEGAKQRVKLGLLIGNIGKKFGIEVSNLEVEAVVRMEAQRYPGQEQMVIDYYKKNPMALETIRGQLFEKRTFDEILKLVKVK